MTKSKEEIKHAIKCGYNKALEEGKFEAELYVRGFIDGMIFEKAGIIPESELDKIFRELKNK